MNKLIGVLVLTIFALGLTARSALADETTLTFNGSYTSDSNSTLFSQPGETFSITFNVPSTLTSALGGGFFSANTLLSFNSPGFSAPVVLPAEIVFKPTSAGGLFQTDSTTEEDSDVVMIGWNLSGQQLYTLNSAGTTATLIPNGVFNLPPAANMFSNAGNFFTDTLGNEATISSGTLTLTSSVPEPSALYLLICGCLALATIKRKFLPS
jgi:hypothetical protein